MIIFAHQKKKNSVPGWAWTTKISLTAERANALWTGGICTIFINLRNVSATLLYSTLLETDMQKGKPGELGGNCLANETTHKRCYGPVQHREW